MEAKTTGLVHLSSVRDFPLLCLRLLALSSRPLPFSSLSVFSLQNGVVHRDLKLENILLDDNCNIKVNL